MSEEQKKLRTILIVDDNPENISLLEAILSAEYATISASRGSDALELAHTALPDLILLDIMMPGMNGYDVCTALMADADTQRIPVIFVTALLDSGDETRGFEAGCVDYLTKPVNGAVVRSRVRAHLALRKAQNELEEWNSNLRKRLLHSITIIRQKTEELMSADEMAAGLQGYVLGVELLSGVFELMEDRFGVRSRAVSELAGDAARQMKLPAADVTKIRLAGLLHDVGTLGNSRGSSEKPEDEMTANEQGEFRSHPVRGQNMFKSLAELQDVGLMVRGHHEAYDGSGFPDGLREDDIPLGARLIAIAVFIEHAASSVVDARDVFALMKARLRAGTLLDPRLISSFSMITRLLYFDGKSAGTAEEIAVPPKELICGMQFSRDLSNQAGILLFQKGDTLDPAGVSLLRRMNLSLEGGGVWMLVSKV
jgi:putative two-component system response regulator